MGRPKKHPKVVEANQIPEGVSKRNLTEVVKIAMEGDPNHLLDESIPLHRLAMKITNELSGPERPAWLQHRLLELFWARIEGKLADKLDVDVAVRGVIALPVVTSSALDWAADAVQILSSARERQTIDVAALPSGPSPEGDA